MLRSGIYNTIGDLHTRALNNAQSAHNTAVQFYDDTWSLYNHTDLGRVAVNLHLDISLLGDNRLSPPGTLHLLALAFRLDYFWLGFIPFCGLIYGARVSSH